MTSCIKSTRNKRIRTTQYLIMILIVALFSGCTWVKKTPEAAKIRIVPADRVGDCTSLGGITTSTVNNISMINRSTEKVKSEIETLAQQEAADMGADTIVATSGIVEGRQSFAAYRCLR